MKFLLNRTNNNNLNRQEIVGFYVKHQKKTRKVVAHPKKHDSKKMELCHSWWALPVRLSSTRRYSPYEVRELCKKVTGPFWLRVEGKLIQVHGEECLRLACQVSPNACLY
jgi:hypothetical protein